MNRPRSLLFSLGLLLAGLSACGGGESVSVLLDPEVRLLRQDLPVPVSLPAALTVAPRWGRQGWVPDIPPCVPAGPARRDAASPATLGGTIELQLDPGQRTLGGRADLTIQAGNQPLDRLVFTLSAAAVDGVACDGGPCGGQFSHSDGTLTVPLDPVLPAGEQLPLTIIWNDAGIEQIWDDFPEGGGPILANLLDSPSSYFTFGYIFYPRLRGEGGNPILEFSVTFPGQRTVLMSGELLHELDNGNGTTTSTWQVDCRPGRAVALVLGNYDRITGSCAGSTLELYYLPGSSIDGYPIVAETYRPIMQALCSQYQERFGTVPVPVVRLAGVDDRFRNGYSAPGLIIVPNYTFDDDGSGSFIERDFFLAHELSHQWWGNAVTVAAAGDIWLIEGMADYIAASALERSRSADDGRYIWLWEARPLIDLWKQGGSDHPLVPPAGTSMDPRVYYIKGAWVLRMLEDVIGGDTLDELLLELATQFRTQPLGTTEFTSRAGTAAGRDMDWFFEQWLSGSGCLALVEEHRLKGDTLELTVTQDRPWSSAPERFYRAPLTVRLGYQQRSTDRSGEITGPETVLQLELP